MRYWWIILVVIACGACQKPAALVCEDATGDNVIIVECPQGCDTVRSCFIEGMVYELNPYPPDTVGNWYTLGYEWLVHPDTAMVRQVTEPGVYTFITWVSGDTLWANLMGVGKVFDLRERCDGRLFIPNAFTPDGDGLNDDFTAKGQYVCSYEMFIVTLEGELIFKSKDIRHAWEGFAHEKGATEIAQAGTYLYRIEVTFQDGENEVYHGRVELVR